MTAWTKVRIDPNDAGGATPLTPVTAATAPKIATTFGERAARWATSTGFPGQPGTVLLIAKDDGAIERVLVAIADKPDPFAIAHLASALPVGTYRLEPHD